MGTVTAKAPSLVVVDSNLTLEEALDFSAITSRIGLLERRLGKDRFWQIVARQRLVNVWYWSFDNRLHRGQILIHQKLAWQIRLFFLLMLLTGFRVNKVTPAVVCDWDDDRLMAVGICHGFNPRLVNGKSKPSIHLYGAWDINQCQNPCVYADGLATPDVAYDINAPGTLFPSHVIVWLAQLLGWEWGGAWNNFEPGDPHDLHHFQPSRKVLKRLRA